MTDPTDEQTPDPNIVLTAGVEEDPADVTGEPVDEDEVLGEAAYLADPAEHQDGDV